MDSALEKLDKLINSQYELTSHLRNLIDGVWGSQIDFALDEVEFKLRSTDDSERKRGQDTQTGIEKEFYPKIVRKLLHLCRR